MTAKGFISYVISIAFFMMGIQAMLLPDLVSTASGSSVDEYIEASNSEATATPSISNQAQESRERYFADRENSTLDWTMPSSLSNSGNTPGESRNTAENQDITESQPDATSTQSSNTSNDVLVEASDRVTQNVSGTWSFRLNDSILRDVSLALFQDGDTIFGTGSMRESNSTYDITASGTLQADSMILNLTSQQPITHYKLSLDLSRDSASGEFNAVSATGNRWAGEAEGLRL